MTKNEFDKLPGLLSAKTFRLVTGLTKDKLMDMRRNGFIIGVRRPGAHKFLYRKMDAAALIGFKLD